MNINTTMKSPLFLSHLSVSLLFLTVILIINISIVLIYQSFRICFDVYFYLEIILLIFILEIKKPTQIFSLGNGHYWSVLRLTKKFLNILMIVKKISCLFSKLLDSWWIRFFLFLKWNKQADDIFVFSFYGRF